MEGVTCPLGDCEYTGVPASVEAHITSMTDETHSGEVGSGWREHWHEPDGPGGDRDDDVLDAPDTDGGVDVEVVDDDQDDETEPVEVEADADLSVPIPVSTPVLFGVLAVGLAFLLVTQMGSGSQPTQPQRSDEETDETTLIG